MLLFSGKKNANKFIGQTFSRKLLGIIVHGLYLLPDNGRFHVLEGIYISEKFAINSFYIYKNS